MGIEQYYVPQSKANICFDCQKACGGCAWSTDFTPVPGWTAEKVMHKYAGVWKPNYHITACPEFVPDDERKPSFGEISEEQMRRLILHWKRRGEL